MFLPQPGGSFMFQLGPELFVGRQQVLDGAVFFLQAAGEFLLVVGADLIAFRAGVALSYRYGIPWPVFS